MPYDAGLHCGGEGKETRNSLEVTSPAGRCRQDEDSSVLAVGVREGLLMMEELQGGGMIIEPSNDVEGVIDDV